jgi:hypothetical protein
VKDPIKLKALILEKLDLARVMSEYQVQFTFNPLAASEVQFRCPFHGKDNKPSARLYKETKSCYCWVCQKSWDVVTFIQQKEGFKFIPALKYLVNRYSIDTSSIPDDPEFSFPRPQEITEEGIRESFIQGRLSELRGKLPFEKFNAICAAYLMISFKRSQKEDVLPKLILLEQKVTAL